MAGNQDKGLPGERDRGAESYSWSRGTTGGWFSWPLSTLLRGACVGCQLLNRLRGNSKHAIAELSLVCVLFFLSLLAKLLWCHCGVVGRGVVSSIVITKNSQEVLSLCGRCTRQRGER